MEFEVLAKGWLFFVLFFVGGFSKKLERSCFTKKSSNTVSGVPPRLICIAALIVTAPQV